MKLGGTDPAQIQGPTCILHLQAPASPVTPALGKVRISRSMDDWHGSSPSTTECGRRLGDSKTKRRLGKVCVGLLCLLRVLPSSLKA